MEKTPDESGIQELLDAPNGNDRIWSAFEKVKLFNKTETLILFILLKANHSLCFIEIANETQSKIPVSSLYVLLARMEEDGLIERDLSPGRVRTGRGRKSPFFKITELSRPAFTTWVKILKSIGETDFDAEPVL